MPPAPAPTQPAKSPALAARIAISVLVPVLALFALTFSAAGCSRNRVEPPTGDILADLALPMVNGDVFDPKALYSRDVLVMFFSPSCGHCMREMPEAVAAAEKAGSAVLAVMVGGTVEQAERLAVADRLTAPVILDDGQLRRKYGIRAVPYTLVLGSGDGGRAERAFVGAQGQERLASALADVRD